MREALLGLGIALLGGPLVRAAIWRAPLSALTTREVLVTALGPAMAYVATLLVTRLALVIAGTDEVLALGISCFVGDVVALALVALSSFRTRLVGLLRVLAEDLDDPARRQASITLLDRVLDAARPAPEADLEAYGQLVVHLAGVLVGANDHATAKRTLERVDGTVLSPSLHTKHAQCLATVCLELGDLERADAVLAAVADPEDDPLTTRWLRVTRALLFAVQGGTDSALALVSEAEAGARGHDAEDDENEPAFLASYEVVRAHVHACVGEEERAREALERARELAGVVALTRAIRPVGPATEIARTLLARDLSRMRGAAE